MSGVNGYNEWITNSIKELVTILNDKKSADSQKVTAGKLMKQGMSCTASGLSDEEKTQKVVAFYADFTPFAHNYDTNITAAIEQLKKLKNVDTAAIQKHGLSLLIGQGIGQAQQSPDFVENPAYRLVSISDFYGKVAHALGPKSGSTYRLLQLQMHAKAESISKGATEVYHGISHIAKFKEDVDEMSKVVKEQKDKFDNLPAEQKVEVDSQLYGKDKSVVHEGVDFHQKILEDLDKAQKSIQDFLIGHQNNDKEIMTNALKDMQVQAKEISSVEKILLRGDSNVAIPISLAHQASQFQRMFEALGGENKPQVLENRNLGDTGLKGRVIVREPKTSSADGIPGFFKSIVAASDEKSKTPEPEPLGKIEKTAPKV